MSATTTTSITTRPTMTCQACCTAAWAQAAAFFPVVRVAITRAAIRQVRLYLILFSYELYGDAQYWWVFALYNRNSITDPINDFTTGKRIYVPERDIIAGIQ